MTDTIDTDTTAAAATAAPKRQAAYDEDLVVQLVAEGQLSFRKIADQAGTSAMTVSAIARGHSRPDLHERICRAVEAAHRRARRRAAAGLDAVVKKQFALALESEGETSRKACEFIIRTYANAPDPAGRYVGLPGVGGRGSGGRSAGGAPISREELDLLAAVRGAPGAPAFGDLTAAMRTGLKALVPKPLPYDDNPEQAQRDRETMTRSLNHGYVPLEPDYDDYFPPAVPRTDYDTGLPDDEFTLRFQLAGLRSNACFAYPGYLGRFRDDLFTAGLTGDQTSCAGRDAEPSWLDDRQTMMGREAALITKTAQLRHGDDVIETEPWLGRIPHAEYAPVPGLDPTGNEIEPALAKRLDALRTLEQSDFTLTPASADVTDETPADSDAENTPEPEPAEPATPDAAADETPQPKPRPLRRNRAVRPGS